MKKIGFSLSELLIALSIIAIGAALLAPAYMNNKPDKYKFRVLKYYNLVNEVTTKLLDNPDMYYRLPIGGSTTYDPKTGNPTGQYGCDGLNCTEQPQSNLTQYDSNYQGICKYPNLLADTIQLANFVKCTPGTTSLATGDLPDGSAWIIAKDTNVAGDYIITIDMDSLSNSPDCPYDKKNCVNPDTFIFKVDQYGDIKAGDNLTKIYLKNMTNTKKSVDFDEAKKL